MRYKFFNNSEKTWKAMFGAIAQAEESIYLEMYIFSNDIPQYDFLRLLKEKAKSGLRVRVVLDSFGSMNLGAAAANELKGSGAELFFLSHIFHRAHRKILIVDEKVAFVGGVNFGKTYEHWNDLAVQVRGSLVKHIVRSFAKVYVYSGGKDSQIVAKNKVAFLDKTRSWIVEHLPNMKNSNMKNVYTEYINKTSESIIMATPYMIPNRWLVKVLHQAVLRGVKVEILIPVRTDSFVVNEMNYFFMRKLSALGVSFYLVPIMNHSKLMIMDNREAVMGSQNLDFYSFGLNSEIGVFFKDAKAVKKILEIYNSWKADATLLDLKTYKPKWFDYIISPIFTIFSRML